jgi:hypothetical protein
LKSASFRDPQENAVERYVEFPGDRLNFIRLPEQRYVGFPSALILATACTVRSSVPSAEGSSSCPPLLSDESTP